MKKSICDLCQQDIDTPCKKGDFDHLKVRIEVTSPYGAERGNGGCFQFEMCIDCARTLQIYPHHDQPTLELTHEKRVERIRETLKHAMLYNRQKGM